MVKRVKCKLCPKTYAYRRGLWRHVEKEHPELAPPKKVYLKCPIANKKGFRFVKTKVYTCLLYDKDRAERRAKRRAREIARRKALGIKTDDMEELVPFVMPSNQVRQEITKKIHTRWSNMEGDDAGGFVKPVLEPFNIFQLTLERNCNTPDHFVDNDLENISLVILGINNCAVHKKKNTSLTGTYGKGTVAELKRRRNLPVDFDAIMARESKSKVKYGGERTSNVVYESCATAYKRDIKTKAQFSSLQEFFHHGLELLRAQGGRCAISDIPMDGHRGSDDTFFNPSLDAIDPTLGHVKGNLQWVILCLNAIDRAKRNKANSKKSRWTREKFKQYIGVHM